MHHRMQSQGGPCRVFSSNFLILQRRKLRFGERKPLLPPQLQNTQRTSDGFLCPDGGLWLQMHTFLKVSYSHRTARLQRASLSCLWEVVGWPWLSRVFREPLMLLGKAGTGISNVLLNTLDPRAERGQTAVPRASVGTLTSSQCNDSKADYVLGGVAMCLAFPLSFRWPLVISWLIDSVPLGGEMGRGELLSGWSNTGTS